MDKIHFENMMKARDAEKDSEHEVHKVGALIHGFDSKGEEYQVAKANYWPPSLKQHIGTTDKLGNASTTVHAEIAAICASPSTENSSIYVTDFPCPNCAKVIAEARLKNVYIDSHTHQTPLGKKIKPYFDKVTTLILSSAGINVFEIDVENKTIQTIVESTVKQSPHIENPVIITEISPDDIGIEDFTKRINEDIEGRPFAACYAEDITGQYSFMFAYPHRSVGLTETQAEDIRDSQNKYKPNVQPINRLLLTAARYGLEIHPDYLYSSQVPTSREFVNMIGAGFQKIRIGNKEKCRDSWGIQALRQLEEQDIIEILESPKKL